MSFILKAMDELTLLQRKTLDLFAETSLCRQFYWTGGTALAVAYLHHRKSQDLDFFSDEQFSVEDVTEFVQSLKDKIGLKFVEAHRVFDRREFFLHNDEEVRLEFVHYDHPKLAERTLWNGILVDSLDDIAANKLMALFDRNEPKDVVDLYFLFTKGGYAPSVLLPFVEKKFGVQFDESMIWSEAMKGLEQLGQLQPILLGNTGQQKELLRQIKAYLETQSKQFLKGIIE